MFLMKIILAVLFTILTVAWTAIFLCRLGKHLGYIRSGDDGTDFPIILLTILIILIVICVFVWKSILL